MIWIAIVSYLAIANSFFCFAYTGLSGDKDPRISSFSMTIAAIFISLLWPFLVLFMVPLFWVHLLSKPFRGN